MKVSLTLTKIIKFDWGTSNFINQTVQYHLIGLTNDQESEFCDQTLYAQVDRNNCIVGKLVYMKMSLTLTKIIKFDWGNSNFINHTVQYHLIGLTDDQEAEFLRSDSVCIGRS